MLTLACIILSLHFGRVLAGNVYRACPAFVMSKEQLAQMLGKSIEGCRTIIQEDGSLREQTFKEWDVAAITKFERCRFFAHCLLAN